MSEMDPKRDGTVPGPYHLGRQGGGMPASTDDKLKHLGNIELFRHCSRKDLEAVAAITEERALDAGAVLCDQGRVATQCFIVLDGSADVEINGRQVATVGPGEAVGEMGL